MLSKDEGLLTKTRLYKALVLSEYQYYCAMLRHGRWPKRLTGSYLFLRWQFLGAEISRYGTTERCRHKKGSRDQPECRQPRTLKTTLVLWVCGPYVTKPHPEHHAIIWKCTQEETSGQWADRGRAGSKSQRRLQKLGYHSPQWRKQTNCRGTGRGGGVVRVTRLLECTDVSVSSKKYVKNSVNFCIRCYIRDEVLLCIFWTLII